MTTDPPTPSRGPRRPAYRCICGKPIRKGTSVELLIFAHYRGRNESGDPVVEPWLQVAARLRCQHGRSEIEAAGLARAAVRLTRERKPA